MLTTTENSIQYDVAAAKDGDLQAFTRIISIARNTVTSIALAIVRDLDNSEEVAQQVFISVWENLSQLKNTASFFPWIRQMTRYKAYNFLRDSKFDRTISGGQADQLLNDFCDPKSNQVEQIERTQQSQILDRFINDLPAESREIVLLYYREEESSKQVAELLEISEANVRKKLSRIRKLLKQQLLDKYGQLLLSTAPTIAFSSLVVSAISTSTPVAASAMTASVASGNTGALSKILLPMSGALIGVLGGLAGIIWGARKPIQRISDEQAKTTMRRYRNQTVAWVVISGIVFATSFELSKGWIFPVLIYLLLALGLIVNTRKMANFALDNIYPNTSTPEDTKRKQSEKMWHLVGLIGGTFFGFAGLIIGLIAEGRIG